MIDVAEPDVEHSRLRLETLADRLGDLVKDLRTEIDRLNALRRDRGGDGDGEPDTSRS